MIRRPPRSTLDRSSAASDVYKRQIMGRLIPAGTGMEYYRNVDIERDETVDQGRDRDLDEFPDIVGGHDIVVPPREPIVVPSCLLYTSDAADERSSVDLG